MRKILTMLLLTLVASAVYAQSHVEVFLMDEDGPYTNVRNAPSGKIVDKIPTSGECVLLLTGVKNGWWKIVDNCYITIDGDVKLKGSATGYWIHYSCVGFATRNYGGQRIQLRATPSEKAKATYTFTDEQILRPVGVKGQWIKVRTIDGRHEGWIDKSWICANPYSNCC